MKTQYARPPHFIKFVYKGDEIIVDFNKYETFPQDLKEAVYKKFPNLFAKEKSK